MKINKKLFFKIHSWIGVKLSILFFIVCFSGTLATLSHEMDWLFISEIRAIPQKTLASKNLTIEYLKTKYPNGKITYWMKSEEPYLCDIIYLDNGALGKTYVFANPYTGKIQGEANLTFQRFFRDLHYFLFIPFQIGNFTVLIFGFLLFISTITALCFYKTWWKKLFKIQTGKGRLVFFRSLHRLVGVWSVPFAILFSITGIWYFLERANVGNLGELVNPKYPKIEISASDLKEENLSYTIDYDKAYTIAKQQIPHFKMGSITPSKNREKALYLRGKSNEPLVRQRANRVYLNPNNYKVLKVQRADQIGTLMWLNDIVNPLHFGTFGGLATKIIWFFAGLAISILVLSGIWITLKRKKIRQKHQVKVMGIWKYVNWIFNLIIFGFMYFSIIVKYQVSVNIVCIISLTGTFFIVVGYYIFVHRLNKMVEKKVL